MYCLAFSWLCIVCLLPCLYFSLYTNNTVLVNRGTPPKATAKGISPAPSLRGHFLHLEAPGALLQMCFSFSATACTGLHFHTGGSTAGTVCTLPAVAAVCSLPHEHKPTDCGMKGSGEVVEPQQEELPCHSMKPLAFSKSNRISCLPGLLRHTWPLFLLPQREPHQLLASSPTGRSAFLPHQQFKQVDVQMKEPAQGKIQSLIIDGGFQLRSICSGCENSTSFYSGSSSKAECLSWLRGRTWTLKGYLAA